MPQLFLNPSLNKRFKIINNQNKEIKKMGKRKCNSPKCLNFPLLLPGVTALLKIWLSLVLSLCQLCKITIGRHWSNTILSPLFWHHTLNHLFSIYINVHFFFLFWQDEWACLAGCVPGSIYFWRPLFPITNTSHLPCQSVFSIYLVLSVY